MVVAWTYAVAVNFVPAYKLTVDKVGQSTVGLQNQDIKVEEAETAEKHSAPGGETLNKEGGPVHIER